MLLDIVEKWTAIWSILILISKLMTNFCNGLYVVNIYQTDDKQFAKWILSYKKIRVQYTYYVTIPRWSPTLLKSIPSLKSEFWSQIYAPFFYRIWVEHWVEWFKNIGEDGTRLLNASCILNFRKTLLWKKISISFWALFEN